MRFMEKELKIAVAGTGYVGLSMAVLLSQRHQVTAVDILPEKVQMINRRESPIQDEYIEKYFAEKKLDLTATMDWEAAYQDADLIIIAVPTNYDSTTQKFDTSAVEQTVQQIMSSNSRAVVVIKSTVPVGYTQGLSSRIKNGRFLFSPEFLRESKALYDNLYPSRIIVGTDLNSEKAMEAARIFAELLQEGAEKENVDTLFMSFTDRKSVV